MKAWYAVALMLAGILAASVAHAAPVVSNGSFEQGLTDWNATGFRLLASWVDMAGGIHLPTHGLLMVGITSADGRLSQTFTFTSPLKDLTFERNVVDPSFALGNLEAMITHVTIGDSTGRPKLFSIVPGPMASNQWETRTLPLGSLNPQLTVGEQYTLAINASPNRVICVPVIGPPDPICGAVGSGTVLIDHVTLSTAPPPTPVPLPPTAVLFCSGWLLLLGLVRRFGGKDRVKNLW